MLDGTIPSEISLLTMLQSLDLHTNRLTGTLSSTLSALTRLSDFRVFGNSLSSIIPSELSALTLIEYLDMSSNHFRGHISSSFKYLVYLKLFDISKNFLSGNPFFFMELSTLVSVNISQNLFSDTTGWDDDPLPNPNLLYLDLSHCYLRGRIPNTISKFSPNILSFVISSNCLDVSLPKDLCNLNSLQTLVMNKLGSECSDTNIRANLFSQSYATIPECYFSMHQLTILQLMSNKLYGTISDKKNSLISLNLIGNLLTGKTFLRGNFGLIVMHQFNNIYSICPYNK